jgi:hypothetical protein
MPGRPIEQLDAQVGFQVADLAADERSGNFQAPGRFAEAAHFGEPGESAHMVEQVHLLKKVKYILNN